MCIYTFLHICHGVKPLGLIFASQRTLKHTAPLFNHHRPSLPPPPTADTLAPTEFNFTKIFPRVTWSNYLSPLSSVIVTSRLVQKEGADPPSLFCLVISLVSSCGRRSPRLDAVSAAPSASFQHKQTSLFVNVDVPAVYKELALLLILLWKLQACSHLLRVLQ